MSLSSQLQYFLASTKQKFRYYEIMSTCYTLAILNRLRPTNFAVCCLLEIQMCRHRSMNAYQKKSVTSYYLAKFLRMQQVNQHIQIIANLESYMSFKSKHIYNLICKHDTLGTVVTNPCPIFFT